MNAEDLRGFISGLYTEKMIWTKDSKKKMQLMKHRNKIETDDNAFRNELIEMENIIKRAREELDNKNIGESSWESVTK